MLHTPTRLWCSKSLSFVTPINTLMDLWLHIACRNRAVSLHLYILWRFNLEISNCAMSWCLPSTFNIEFFRASMRLEHFWSKHTILGLDMHVATQSCALSKLRWASCIWIYIDGCREICQYICICKFQASYTALDLIPSCDLALFTRICCHWGDV